MKRFHLIIAVVVVSYLLGCGNKKSSNEEVADKHPNASLIDSIEAVTQSYGIWITDLNEGSGLVNPPQNTLTTELLYDADKEKFYIREQWVYKHNIKTDTIYKCKVKKTRKGILLIGIGDECTFEIYSTDKIEGIWSDVEYRTHGQGSIQLDIVKTLMEE